MEVSSESESNEEEQEHNESEASDEYDPKAVDGIYSVETAEAWLKKNVCLAKNRFVTSRSIMNRFGIKNMHNMHRAMMRVFGSKVVVMRRHRDRGWLNVKVIGTSYNLSQR